VGFWIGGRTKEMSMIEKGINIPKKGSSQSIGMYICMYMIFVNKEAFVFKAAALKYYYSKPLFLKKWSLLRGE
jgi:hypothetical protein